MPCSFGGLIGTDNEDEPQEARQAIPGNDDRRASQSNGGVRQGVRCRQGSALVSANATPLGTGQGQVAPFQKAPPAERVDLARLSTTERIVVLVSRANFEVELGGLSAFFYNSAGNYAAETLLALETVGAVHAAAALRAAMALFPGGSPAADRERRYTAWRTVAASLGSLDQEFGRDKPDVFSRLCSFIAGHAAELRQHGAEG